MKYTGLKQFESNDKNPFMEDTVTHIKKGYQSISVGRSRDILVNSETGDTVGHTLILAQKKVDKSEFRKIFIDKISHWFKLSKPGIRVLGYVLNSLVANKDYIDFNIAKCMDFTGYKGKYSVLQGMTELIENKFIARAEHPYKYYINPSIIFNGNRLSLLESYIVEPELINNPTDEEDYAKHIEN